MTDREKLEETKAGMIADHDKFVKLHESNMAAINQLILLTDLDTGMFPAVFLDLMRKELAPESATKAHTDLRPLVPQNLEEAIYGLMETGQDTYFTADKSWSARQIYIMLESRNYPFPQDLDAAINSVSTVLIRMMDKGILERTIKGSGRSPSLYRWIRAEDRPANTVRSYPRLVALAELGKDSKGLYGSFTDPSSVRGFGFNLPDAIKGGTLGTFIGPEPSAFALFAEQQQKEKEASEETS